QILKRAPRFGPAHLEKAKYYDRSGDVMRAISEARLALSSDGIDVNSERAAHILLARCHSILGNAEEAAKERQGIGAHPNPATPRKLNQDIPGQQNTHERRKSDDAPKKLSCITSDSRPFPCAAARNRCRTTNAAGHTGDAHATDPGCA